MTYHLGIDVGTTYTAASIVRDGQAEVVPLGTRIAEIPSVVFLTDEGTFVVGEAAVRRGVTEPTRLAREFKRRLGDPVPILLGGSPQSAQSLVAEVLKFVVDTVAGREGEPASSVMVTHPASWGPFKRDLLGQALQLADLPSAGMLTEPEAAAVHYASGTRVDDGEVIAVYDLGGGTFDVAVLRKSPSGFTLLGTPEGVEHLGGIDFDEAVFTYVIDSMGEAVRQLDAADPAVLTALTRLRRECVEAKEALSADTTVSIPVLLPNLQGEIRLTRPEFEAMIRPSIVQTVDALVRGVRSAGVAPEALAAVVLVGGSSRIPLVAESVRQAFDVPLATDAHPKHSIALGAAMVCAAGGIVGAHDGGDPPAGADPVPTSPAPTPAPELPALAPAGPADGARRRWIAPVAAVGALALAGGVAMALGGSGGDDEGGGSASTTTIAVEPAIVPPAAIEAAGDDVIVFTSQRAENWDLYAVSADGTGERQLTSNPAADLLGAWSPDRRSIAHSRQAGNWSIRIIPADANGEELPIAGDIAADARVAWSPDGTTLLFASERDGASDLYMLDLDTGEAEPLTDDDTVEGDPAWSPDGSQIALWRTIDGNQDLWVLDVEATRALREAGEEGVAGERITDDDALDADPAWSPDGTKILFASTRDGNWDLFVLPTDGSGAATQLTDDPADDQTPAWSPDGSRIAFETRRDAGDAEIYVMDADGSNPRNLTNRPGIDVHAAWASPGP